MPYTPWKPPIAADFASPSTDEMRGLWKQHPDDEVLHRVLKELHRLRDVIDRIDANRESIARAWSDANLGTLAALHVLRILLGDEKRRAGRFGPS